MTTKKYKRMTIAEKERMKKTRKELRNEGILPPVKQRLNRKKFRDEVTEEYKQLQQTHDVHYLLQAISIMAPGSETKSISSEEVGVLKVMKMAVEIKKFEENKSKNGETTYKAMELYDEVIKPIFNM